MTHKFIIGQFVDLAPSSLRAAAPGQYEIKGLMPASDISSDSPRYRIKSIAEKHDRIAAERDLSLRSEAFSRNTAARGFIALPVIEP